MFRMTPTSFFIKIVTIYFLFITTTTAGEPITPHLYGRLSNYDAQISPDGNWLFYSQREKQKTRIILAKADGSQPQTILKAEDAANVFFATWTQDSRSVMINGISTAPRFEEFIYVIDAKSGKRKDLLSELTNPVPVYFSISGRSFFAAPILLFGEKNKNTLYQLNMQDGSFVPRIKDGNITPFNLATCPDILFGIKFEADSSFIMLKSEKNWRLIREITNGAIKGENRLASCSATAREIYFTDSEERNFLSLSVYSLDTLQKKYTTQDKGDISRILFNRETGELDSYTVDYVRPHVIAKSQPSQVISSEYQDQFRGEFFIQSHSNNRRKYLITGQSKGNVTATYLWEADKKNLHKLFDSRVDMKGWPLTEKTAATYYSSDGIEMVAYLTHPEKRCANNACPMVLIVHGGPGERDSMETEPVQQWFASQGYLAMSVNFRGSKGVGKNLEALGHGQWGLKMQDDLRDAAVWAINQKLADPKRIAIYGTSYGGFAALNGITRDSDLFSCAVAISAQADLPYFVEERTKRVPGTDIDLYTRVGNINLPLVKEDLLRRSPIAKVPQLNRPILAINIEKDSLATDEEMVRFSTKIDQYHKEKYFSLFTFKGSGHVFNSIENENLTWSLTQSFLSRCLLAKPLPVNQAEIDASTLLRVKDGYGLLN